MKAWLLASILLSARLGCKAAGVNSSMVYGFDAIEPSANLTWTPCFDDFTCSKLEVPIDYANTSLGTTSVAFIKLAGKNATADSPSIVFIPGGPGGTGIGLLRSYKNMTGQIFGEQYNIVSFDPRGVNNSGRGIDCFSGNNEARQAFVRLHATGVANLSDTGSVEEQFYSSDIYGEWCNHAVATGEGEASYGYYVTTPASVRDLLSFVEAEARLIGKLPSEAKLWAYGISYGTVVGMTFASMFPDRVGRMVLDGVVNAEQYYHNDWREAMDQLDESMEAFVGFCHSAGPEKCSFWGDSPENITARLDTVIERLRTNPIPFSGVPDKLPSMITISDLKSLFISSIYLPLAVFPLMADALRALELGVKEPLADLAGLWNQMGTANFASDANYAIKCSDSYGRNNITTLDEYKSYVQYAASKSKYMGDLFPMFVETVACSGFRPELPESMLVRDPISGPQRNTSFPILFTSNTIDAITPLVS
ncbi:hypothetical protein V8F20_002876 [Naviculisporaceae sp. PSN 640]